MQKNECVFVSLSTSSNKFSQRGCLLQKPKNSKMIDLYLTHNSLSLQDILSVFTCFSDFLKLVRAVLKVTFIKS